MATCQGYKCEFIDSVPDEFYCKKCTLVARRLVYTSCCEEIFCHDCIADIHSQDKHCPVCSKENFSILEFKRYQKKVMQLQVYCNMKERGCVWSGTLEQLDTHLNPHLNNCQYVDTQCPLYCLQTIPKNKMEQHVAQECSKRPHVCQHCGYKATYEEVVDTHLPECKYVPLQCPNMCGVSCEREVMEDHMKICRLEEVECEFSSVGCDGRFIREDQDEHDRQNSQKHLTLTASLTVQTQQQLLQKLQEQDKKHKEEEEKLKMKIGEQEKKIEEQEKKLGVQEIEFKEQDKKQQKRLSELEKKLEEQEKKIEEQQEKLTELNKVQMRTTKDNDMSFNQLEAALERSLYAIYHQSRFLNVNRRFVMKNFSKEKAKDKSSDWKSPVMYTHSCGYKFCIEVDANGWRQGRGKSIYVDLWPMAGEFDDYLKWPVEARFTIELVNPSGGENAKSTKVVAWEKNKNDYFGFIRIPHGFMEHASLGYFMINDMLIFHISKIKIL